MTSPLDFLVALTASLLVGLALLGYVWARRQTAAVAHGLRLDVSLPPAAAIEVAAAGFEASQWSPVSGDGCLNMAHVRPGRPVVSVAVVDAVAVVAAVEAGSAAAVVTTGAAVAGGSEVHIWMSGWTLQAGIVRHARLARAQMAAVHEALMSAEALYDASLAASPTGSFGSTPESTADGARPHRASRSVRATTRREAAQGAKHSITA